MIVSDLLVDNDDWDWCLLISYFKQDILDRLISTQPPADEYGKDMCS